MSAVRTTLTGSMMPALTRSSNSPVSRVCLLSEELLVMIDLGLVRLDLVWHDLDLSVDFIELAEPIDLVQDLDLIRVLG